ncbi:hypothetical protein BG004_002523 [Podila humilis]|nr:hypothetical protein BG004_002523 [Podila humilis]
MESLFDDESSIFQTFKSYEGLTLGRLQTHVCEETGERYIPWSEILQRFHGIEHLEQEWPASVLFMIDLQGEIRQPLRVPHSPSKYYRVIYIRRSESSAGNPGLFLPQDGSFLPILDPNLGSDWYRVSAQYPLVHEVLIRVGALYEACLALYDPLMNSVRGFRHEFLQVLANTKFYHSMLLTEIERLEKAGVKVEIGEGSDPDQVRAQLVTFDEHAKQLDFENAARDMLHGLDRRWDFATSLFFIILPTHLGNAWRDDDPSTHRFRIHFLCDMKVTDARRDSSEIPLHVHMSNHPGYNIHQQDEFLQEHGDYVLRVLKLVKFGYYGGDGDEYNSNNEDKYEIPLLETREILWGCEDSVTGNCFTSSTIRPLVDKAISYLEKLSPPKQVLYPGLTDAKSTSVKSFLDIPDGDNGAGGLNRVSSRYLGTFWKCSPHIHQTIPENSLDQLKNFVRDYGGGHVSVQKAHISLELRSEEMTDKFRSLLVKVKHPFDVSIRLQWAASESCLWRLCRDIGTSQTLALFIDGVTLDIQPQDPVQQMRNLFAEISLKTEVQITLLNYPTPQEQTIYAFKSWLQVPMSSTRPDFSWVDLRRTMYDFGEMVISAQRPDWIVIIEQFLELLGKSGFQDMSKITIYDKEWAGVIDLERKAFVEVHCFNMVFPKALDSAGLISRLTHDRSELDVGGDELERLVPTNRHQLKELNVSTLGRNVFRQIDHICKLWQGPSSLPLRVTLFERLSNGQGRIMGELDVRGPRASTSVGQPPSGQVNLLHWEQYYNLSWPDDHSLSSLDMVTKSHRLELGSLVFDISRLSRSGLASLQRVLARSTTLDNLHLICSSFDSSFTSSVSDVLQAVPWHTLSSLVLSGNRMDTWLGLCASSLDAPRLLSLTLYGAGSDKVLISHEGVLALHQLIESSQATMIELKFENILLQAASEWMLIVDSCDPSYLNTLQLCKAGADQILTSLETIHCVYTKFGQGEQCPGTDPDPTLELTPRKRLLTLASFTLDLASTVQQNRSAMLQLICLCKFDTLRIVCSPLDLQHAESIVQVLNAVDWSTLKTLVLTGEDINNWTWYMMATFTINKSYHQLESLDLVGTGLSPELLTRTSIIFVEGLLEHSPLKQISFKNVLLQHKDAWFRIIESVKYPEQRMFLCSESKQQLVSCKSAFELFNSKTIETSKTKTTMKKGVVEYDDHYDDEFDDGYDDW